MKGEPSISPIWRQVPSAPDGERMFSRIWRWCRDLWVEQGTIVAKPSELPEHLREPLVAWATDTYGERKNAR